MKKDDLIASVMGVLKVGRENAISFKQLANRSNLGIGRLVHALAFCNEEFGIIVAKNSRKKNVYYLPEDTEQGTKEAKEYYFKVVNTEKDGATKHKGLRNLIIDRDHLF